MKNSRIKKLVLAAMFLGLGLVLPFLTGQIKQIGSMLLPMHIPVLLCGLLCGQYYGLAVGFITPLLRSFLFHRPIIFPDAASMAFELCTYGFVVGYLYSHAKWHCTKSLFRSMVISMISGRIVWGIVQVIFLGIGKDGFTFTMFISGAVINAIPGIILQLILIPIIMVALGRAKLVPFGKHGKRETKNDAA